MSAGAIALTPGAAGAQRARAASGTQGTRPATSTHGGLTASWPTFDYNPQRSGVGPAHTGITPANVRSLRRRAVAVGGTVDSAAIALGHVRIGHRLHDLVIATTSYGRTVALDAATGRLLWSFFPSADRRLEGSAQITTAAPVADATGRYVYVATPDGFVHELSTTSGHERWRTRVTWLPSRQKLTGSLNLADGELIVVTGGYLGDIPPYQGHVVTLDPANGAITHVWNALCSTRAHLIRSPRSCPASGAAIWGRPGSVVEPHGRILVTTGNGQFNGSTDWGDSVLELSPRLRLLRHWTPRDQARLNADDLDLGSTEPALLGAAGATPLAVQGGKDGLLRVLDLDALVSVRGPAGPRTEGQLQSVAGPGPTDLFSQPTVWHDGRRTYLFATDADGTAAYVLAGRRLHRVWSVAAAGTSPVLAGGMLYVYDPSAGRLNVRNPRTGALDASLPAAPGHWNSPIVVAGRVILPVGDANDHRRAGTIYIYHLPR